MQFTKEHLIWCAQERIGAAREIAEATPSPAERSACEVSIALLDIALATLTGKVSAALVVKLPERYDIEMSPVPSPNGEWYSRDDVLETLDDAGIQWQDKETK